MRKLDLGGHVVYALTDCAPSPARREYSFPHADFAGEPELAEHWMQGGLFRTRFGAFLICTTDSHILVDCGLGPGPVTYFPGLAGNLPAQLAQACSSSNMIDMVIFTHLHIDHVGWASTMDARPQFAKARYLVGDQEWAHWSEAGDNAGLPHHVDAVRRAICPLARAGALEPTPPGAQVAPGIGLLPTPGHTPGHQSVLVSGTRDSLLIAGDLWHNPAQISVPAWGHRADMNQTVASRTRTEIALRATRESWIVAAGHFVDEHTFGRIKCRQDRLAFEPVG